MCVDKPEELRLAFPPSRGGIMKPTMEELQARGEGLIEFMVKLLEAAPEMQEKGRRLMCEFFDVSQRLVQLCIHGQWQKYPRGCLSASIIMSYPSIP